MKIKHYRKILKALALLDSINSDTINVESSLISGEIINIVTLRVDIKIRTKDVKKEIKFLKMGYGNERR